MVALLKDNGEFTPMPVVCDTAKYEQLKAEMEIPAKPVVALLNLIQENRARFVTVYK
ncbi:hypothetical protein V9K92_01235 [Phyllobacterium sp. CCNWLW109]|uniref:hypothetical protein n=1 Tax=Phyllobacterium sp. CCNWLW109 TaxID=3127479 RepID=UPI003076F287